MPLLRTASARGRPRSHLVILTSGEVRISGVFPWQSAHAELYVSPRMWPAFTEADFDAALAPFARVRGRVQV